MSNLRKLTGNSEEDTALQKLLDSGEFVIDENTGLPVKVNSIRTNNYSEMEVCCLILPYVRENVTISNYELTRITGLNRKTITKYRNSKTFFRLLAEHTNKEMVTGRSIAVDVLINILKSEKASDTSKIKASQTLLQHSEKMAEIAVQAGKEPPAKLEDILKELEEL